MTKKHFKALAQALGKMDSAVARLEATHRVAQVCKEFNENFDYIKFCAAVEQCAAERAMV